MEEKGYRVNVLIVDGNSTDLTREVALDTGAVLHRKRLARIMFDDGIVVDDVVERDPIRLLEVNGAHDPLAFGQLGHGQYTPYSRAASYMATTFSVGLLSWMA